jgi:hypothetical protein
MMMLPANVMRVTLVLWCLIAPAEGFGTKDATTWTRRRPFVVVMPLKASQLRTADPNPDAATVEGDSHIMFDPMEGYKGVDMARAHACADHFGQCTVDEMQELRDSYVFLLDENDVRCDAVIAALVCVSLTLPLACLTCSRPSQGADAAVHVRYCCRQLLKGVRQHGRQS